jgi:hypothetical protein
LRIHRSGGDRPLNFGYLKQNLLNDEPLYAKFSCSRIPKKVQFMLENYEAKVRSTLPAIASPMGHFQPLSIHPGDWLLSGV